MQKKTKVETVGMIEITAPTQTLNHCNSIKVKLSIMEFKKEIFRAEIFELSGIGTFEKIFNNFHFPFLDSSTQVEAV